MSIKRKSLDSFLPRALTRREVSFFIASNDKTPKKPRNRTNPETDVGTIFAVGRYCRNINKNIYLFPLALFQYKVIL
jgi:hypothetical protein